MRLLLCRGVDVDATDSLSVAPTPLARTPRFKILPVACLSVRLRQHPPIAFHKIPREDLALLWELPAAGKPVNEALSPARAMEHLDRLLAYHSLEYVDAFVMEIPMNAGGEVRSTVIAVAS